jgi:hypothetical protein
MTENATCFGARRGVGPPRHPSTMRGSRLPKVPDRRRFGLEEGAIRRMQAYMLFFGNEASPLQGEGVNSKRFLFLGYH